jgi:hypothetical protein
MFASGILVEFRWRRGRGEPVSPSSTGGTSVVEKLELGFPH